MILGLVLTSHIFMLFSPIQQAAGAAASGRYFDNIVVVAMENQNYADVMGDGHGTSAAPYIASLLAQGATVPNYHGAYSGCSEACYIALISGDTYGTSNGDRDIGDANTRTLVNLFEAAGVSWQAYCEASCGRDGDHFPWIDFGSITSSSERMSHVDTSASTSNLVNAVGSYNFLWYTPEDSNNMHDNDVASGDAYLASFVPDILAKPGFTSGRSLLMLWWDEYDPAPFLILGPTVLQGYISSKNDIEHYTITKLIEENWGMSSLTSNDVSQPSMGEFFGTSAPPTNPPSNQPPLLPTQVSDLWLILVGVILGGTAGVAIFGVKSRHKNQAKATIQGKDEADTASQKSSRKGSTRRTKSRATRSVSKGRLALVLLSLTLLMGGAFAASLRTPDTNAAPEQASTDTVKFAVAGDWGLNGNSQTNFGLIGAQGVDFALILGDITYGANPEQWCSDFHNAGVSKVILIFGNHDVGESDSDYRERFQAACSPGVTIVDSHLCNLSSCYGELYYFDYPAVGPIMRIIGSNSGLGGNEGDTDYSPGTANFNFVSNAIDDAHARGIPWIFTATHKTCWALSGRGCDIGEGYFQMQVQKKADIIFQAHDHLYLRGKQVSCQAIAVGSFDPSCVVDSTTPYSKGFGSVVMNIGTGGEGTYSPDTGDSEAGYFVCPDTCNDGNVGFGLFTVDSTNLSEVYKNIDSAGFTDSFSIGGTPPPPGQLTASFTFSPTSPLVGQTVTFTGSATGGTPGYSFSWNFGDGASGTGQVATHAYSAANAYQINLAVHDSVGGTDTTTQSITIFNQPPPPGVLSADFTYSPSSPFVGQPITFTGTGSGGRAPYNFAWDFGDSSSATGSAVQHSYSNSGTFAITLRVTDDATNESTATMSVDIASPPYEILTSFAFRDPSSNDVSSALTWQVWDGNNLVSIASQASLDPQRSYELRIFYQGYLIVRQDFTAQRAVQKTIFMYRHHSAPDGYVVFNSTIDRFIMDEDSDSRLRFTAEGSDGPYTIIIKVPKGPAAVLKDASEYPYTYDSEERAVMVETFSLSSWDMEFASSTQPPSICPICPPISSTVISNLWLVVVGGMIGLTTSLAALTHRAHSRLQRVRRLYGSRIP